MPSFLLSRDQELAPVLTEVGMLSVVKSVVPLSLVIYPHVVLITSWFIFTTVLSCLLFFLVGLFASPVAEVSWIESKRIRQEI